jgi:hypothetical protein
MITMNDLPRNCYHFLTSLAGVLRHVETAASGCPAKAKPSGTVTTRNRPSQIRKKTKPPRRDRDFLC